MTTAWTAAVAAFSQGAAMGAALIMAIGAQNALVLRQGLRREHVADVVGVCIVSDLLLILLGVFGLGSFIQSSPHLLALFRWGGAAFLLGYAAWAARRALQARTVLTAAAAPASGRGRGPVLLTALALTYLNPHVYLDTVVLLGGLGARLPPDQRGAFAAGAGLASVLWFSVIGFGAAAMAPVLQRPGIWRLIDGLVALMMAGLGLQLLLRPL